MAQSARAGSVERPLYYILLACITAGVAARFAGLGAQSLWVDELLTLKNAHIGEPGIWSHLARNLQGPAVSALMHFWGGLSRDEAFLRLPFAAAGALTVPAFYLLARELSGRGLAVFATAVLALSPVHIWYSQEIRGYVLVVLFSVLSTYFLVKWGRSRRGADLALYALCLWAGLMSNLTMAFVAAVHFLHLASGRRRAGLVLWWAVAVCAVLVAFYPWVREILVRVEPGRVVAGEAGAPLIAGASFSAMAIPYSAFTFGLGYTLGPSTRELQVERDAALRRNMPYILLGFVGLVLPLGAGFIHIMRRDRGLVWLMVLFLLVPLALVSLIAVRNMRPFNPRYMLVALPAYVMILGAGAAGLCRGRRWPLVLPLAAAVLLSLYNYYGEPRYAKDDMRSAARTIEEAYRDGDVVVAVFTAEPLEFYLEGLTPVQVFGLDDISSPEAMAARSRDLALRGERVWLSLCRDWQVDPGGVIHGWFEDNLNRLESHSFTGVELHLYGKRGI